MIRQAKAQELCREQNFPNDDHELPTWVEGKVWDAVYPEYGKVEASIDPGSVEVRNFICAEGSFTDHRFRSRIQLFDITILDPPKARSWPKGGTVHVRVMPLFPARQSTSDIMALGSSPSTQARL